jgi:1-acyl-sn-glycerol-3-phosphate acyltransferase
MSDAQPRRRGLGYLAGKIWLKAFGWHVEGGPPDSPKAVIIAAPHTSNWDLPFTLAVAAVLGVPISWVGKHTLFKPPFGPVFRWLGGVPVDRSGKHNAVADTVDVFAKHDRLYLVIAPEGTRGRAERWKTGFYRIAEGADIPVVLGFLDYERKVGGLGTMFKPTGDIEKDLEEIRHFYADIKGKRPQKASEIKVGSAKPDEPKGDVPKPV